MMLPEVFLLCLFLPPLTVIDTDIHHALSYISSYEFLTFTCISVPLV